MPTKPEQKLYNRIWFLNASFKGSPVVPIYCMPLMCFNILCCSVAAFLYLGIEQNARVFYTFCGSRDRGLQGVVERVN